MANQTNNDWAIISALESARNRAKQLGFELDIDSSAIVVRPGAKMRAKHGYVEDAWLARLGSLAQVSAWLDGWVSRSMSHC